ncbi:MAG: DUF1080 domain-containing protein [Planctomycetes bacterium]|nr:DUF1080 domain-containing protein [Planctomycetota bacterium]
MLCSPPGRGADLITTREFGDCTVKLDCMLPSGGNSGVYLMGRYEVQLFDSHGRPDDKLRHSDLGGIYSVSAPAKNAAKPAGEWQTLEIQFRAPRFDEHGKKVENARIVSVVLNGVRVQSDVELKGPTGGELPGGEKARGPLMLQGDHSPVAFRNITIQPQ